jgi:hypothetical protein
LQLASTAVEEANHKVAAKVVRISKLKPTRVDSNLYVNEAWVKDFVKRVPEFTDTQLFEYGEFLALEYDSIYKSVTADGDGLPIRVVRKLLVIDALMVLMAKESCEDTRLEKKNPIVTLSPIHGEDTGHKKGHVLLLGRDYAINDPLAFNRIMREAQRSHPSWPEGGGRAIGTKGINPKP